MNHGDTEILKGLVAQRHRICEIEESDTVIINSCAVVGFTERKILRKIVEFRAQGKNVLVAGCLSAYAPEKVIEAGADSILTPHEIFLVNHRLDSSEIIESREKARNEYPKIRYENSSIAIIPIAEGALEDAATVQQGLPEEVSEVFLRRP
ncbi:ribosomal protein S12 methylthiotransferase RimO [archaeon BMS3Bbin15]|nr:ribosomal protein S12 methylthiotransferase RimO [archaeon BMS3Bbin15]